MTIEEPSQLSPSMDSLRRSQPNAVDAGWLVAEIIKTHSQYSVGRLQHIAELVDPPKDLRKQLIQDWFAETRTVLRSDLRELSGRAVIVALALCEPALGRELVRTGLFHEILADTKEGHDLFGERGRACLAKIPRSRVGSPSTPLEPIVLEATGCPGQRGGNCGVVWKSGQVRQALGCGQCFCGG